MENALGEPQTIVLLGGTSDIGLAIVRQLLSPTTRTVVLACRDIERGERAAAGLRHDVAGGRRGRFEATDTDDARRAGALTVAASTATSMSPSLRSRCSATEPSRRLTRPPLQRLAEVNFTGVVSSTIAVANQMRQQGHGSIVMLSSVAGERVRRAQPGVRRHQGRDRRVRPGARRRAGRRRRAHADRPSWLRHLADDRPV